MKKLISPLCLRLLLLLVLASTLPMTMAFSCSAIGDPINDEGDSGGGSGNKLLYAVADLDQAIYIIEDADSSDGTVSPIRTINGSSTMLNNPRSIEVDQGTNLLYVANGGSNSILVFDSTDDGDVVPLRTITVDGFPAELAFDEADDQLFVLDTTNQEIKVWNDVRLANNSTSPSQTIELGAGTNAQSILLDTQRNLLYLYDRDAFEVRIYENAATANGSPDPIATFTACNITGDDACDDFNEINAMTLDQSQDILFVSDRSSPRIHIYENGSDLTDEVADDRFLQGSNTGLSTTTEALAWQDNSLYLINRSNGDIAIWDDADSSDGNQAPDRVMTLEVSGANPRLSDFALDF